MSLKVTYWRVVLNLGPPDEHGQARNAAAVAAQVLPATSKLHRRRDSAVSVQAKLSAEAAVGVVQSLMVRRVVGAGRWAAALIACARGRRLDQHRRMRTSCCRSTPQEYCLPQERMEPYGARGGRVDAAVGAAAAVARDASSGVDGCDGSTSAVPAAGVAVAARARPSAAGRAWWPRRGGGGSFCCWRAWRATRAVARAA